MSVFTEQVWQFWQGATGGPLVLGQEGNSASLKIKALDAVVVVDKYQPGLTALVQRGLCA